MASPRPTRDRTKGGGRREQPNACAALPFDAQAAAAGLQDEPSDRSRGAGLERSVRDAAEAVGQAPVWERIAACRLCAPRFLLTATRHAPRPVVWFRPGARLLIASQAPGARAHESGIPFRDASGERLRTWMEVTEAEFYDLDRVAIVPMGFCFPGYDAVGSDIPPPAICAQTWRGEALSVLPDLRVTLLVGGAAQAWHLGKGGVTERVRNWQSHAPGLFALPHPSWRNTAWIRKNPWFADEVLPALQARVREALDG
jgi:uracil-DNA glycosylase